MHVMLSDPIIYIGTNCRFLNSDECIILHVMFRPLCPMSPRMPQKMRTYVLRTARLVTEDHGGVVLGGIVRLCTKS